ncbi:MAG: hypothetical protein KDA96_23815, partial [Planctomycetaceae bacterium]|nr:hypothetical protein [Planctomycetaceae bacterium]
MSDEGSEPGIDEQLQELQDRAGELINQCLYASSSRLYGELRRRGKSEQRAFFYTLGTFFQMDQAQYLLEFQLMRERAVELIALLEDEEQMRQIQADFPVEQYEYMVYSMSACAYENLAEATGQLEGYNSEGMHACITDGIQICRQTGKLACVSCFREYAFDVYLAADDPEIAAHQSRLVMEFEGTWSDRGNRRWRAYANAAWLAVLKGQFTEALELTEKSLEASRADGVSLPLEARLRAMILRDTVLAALGRPAQFADEPDFEELPPRDECPLFDHAIDLNRALQAVLAQDWNESSRILTQWDQRLQKCGGTHLWFETRLRLIAMKLLSGQEKQAEALSRQLEQKARQANDWLTIHRLSVLMESDQPSPLAVLSNPASAAASSGDASEITAASDNVADSMTSPDDSEQPDDQRTTALSGVLEELRVAMEDLMAEPTEEKFNSLRNRVLLVGTEAAEDPEDAARLIHLLTFLVGDGADGEELWQWANTLAAPHRNSAIVLSVLGSFGDSLRTGPNEEMAEKITQERTEQLFRRSLELDPDRARNYMRAGEHFQQAENIGEAERCFARAFRLDRTDPMIVNRLAALYRNTDRPRDGLHVLDLALREGCEDPNVAFDAGMAAFQLDQYDAAITYLDRAVVLGGEAPWYDYYRALCHLELGRPQEALEAIDREQAQVDETAWHIESVRALACLKQGDIEAAQKHLVFVLGLPLSEVGYLASSGIAALLVRLYQTCREVLHDHPHTKQFETMLLRSGMMPDAYFEELRRQTPERDQVHL